MISVANKQSFAITNLLTTDSRFKKDAARWLKAMREEGATRFSETGFPTPKDEEWKYTNISAIADKKFHFPAEQKIIETEEFERYRDKSQINIVFVNGFFSKEHSNLASLEKNITFCNLADMGKEDPTITPFLNKYEAAKEDSFTALNRAFMHQGAVIKMSDNTIAKKLIHIIHIVSAAKEDVIVFPRTLIILGKSSEAEVLESHLAFSGISYFSDALTDIFLSENAKLKYYKAQGESIRAFHIGTTRVCQERDSQFESFSFSTGALMTRNNLTVALNGEGASSTLDGLYAVAGEQHVDDHTAVDHRPPNCKSNQLYKGILDGNAKAVFNGKIFVRREAQHTNSYQLNKNLLLGSGCQVNTKPQLEIFADDVRCTHGATIGQLNEDELFYLQSRAIPKSQAVRILSRGFVDDVFSSISNTFVRAKMDQLLTRVFSILK